jgi:hypothetical protein
MHGGFYMRLVCGLLLAASIAGSNGFAQQNSAAPPPPVAFPGPDMNQVFSTLSDQPATHTGISFDRGELSAAQMFLEANGVDAKRAAAALTGISFDTYRYAKPAFYTPEAMSALLAGYKASGWKHLVNANQTAANTAQPEHPVTDLWLHFSGADIDAVTVLTRASRNMTVVRITGDLRPLDLLHLGGKFGIPKVDPSAVMVPEKN